MNVEHLIELVALGIEAVGVCVIAIGLVVATLRYASDLARRPADSAFSLYRKRIGRAILLGLEFLVGADIIQTAAVDLSFRSVGVLAIIVLIRTFLSFTIELEIEGRWPWQARSGGPAVAEG